jgi:hypothetical protein
MYGDDPMAEFEKNPKWPEEDKREYLVPEFELPAGAEKKIDFIAGHALRRNRASGNDYGIQGMGIWFTLTGHKGAVTWEWMTPLYPEQHRFEIGYRDPSPVFPHGGGGPIGLHSRTKRDWQTEDDYHAPCSILDGDDCWPDTAYIEGGNMLTQFAMTGSEDAVWYQLSKRYRELPEPPIVIGSDSKKALES